MAILDMYRGPAGPLRHRCPKCTATGPKLRLCSGCHAVRYCGREHQVAHYPQHKAACSKIKKARAKLAKEDHGVRNAVPDIMTPANAFETHVGRFWGLVGTRDYMRARFALAGERLLEMGTLDGVHEALGHMQDMLRLCRSDNMGLRNIVPAMMLRLDLDQECYDFVKWWATCDPDGRYDWGDMTLPHLDVHGADILEDPGFLLGEYPDLNDLVAILLLKLKLLVDLRNLKIVRKILPQRRIPPELWPQVELAAVRSPITRRLHEKLTASLSKTEATLLGHVRRLGAAIVSANEHFVFSLFEPDEALSVRPDSYSAGSWEEMALAMHHSYAAWWETEGVLGLLEDARACAARDSEDEIADMMRGKTFRSGAGSDRTAAELLADVSVNRVWGYLGYAVENASYLGPWSERPSERHMKEQRESLDLESSSDEDAWSEDEE